MSRTLGGTERSHCLRSGCVMLREVAAAVPPCIAISPRRNLFSHALLFLMLPYQSCDSADAVTWHLKACLDENLKTKGIQVTSFKAHWIRS